MMETEVSQIEKLILDRIGDGLLRQVYESSVWSTGCCPAPAECIELVFRHGDEMWDMMADQAGFENVPQRIHEASLGVIESYAEWCVAFVGGVIELTAYHRAYEKGWHEL